MKNQITKLVESIIKQVELLDSEVKQLESYIDTQLEWIKNAHTFEDSTIFFDMIWNITINLGKIVFNSNYKVSDKIYTIFKEYDRIDDIELRKKIYKKFH